jgi:sugar O-acyltransferase (sialic acid O-acetyltransferase NeuD family)
VAFAVEGAYRSKTELFGLPVVAFEEVERSYPPADHRAFVAISYTKLNRVRQRLFRQTKDKGYACLSYVSSRAFVWHDVVIGENCFIFENNVLQYGVRIGDNVVLWSGNHIGHHSVLRDHSFISSHVVISGFCDIGESCFFGVNSTVGNNITVGADCLVGSGALVVRDVPAGSLLKGPMTRPEEVSTWEKLGLPVPSAL